MDGLFGAHLAVSAALGGLIGLERQWHQGMAGLRTNALVAAAATAFVSLPRLLGGEDGTGPAHMSTFVITGIGFLGAGVIMRDGANVRGLNTAATLWGRAWVGALVGSGLWAEAATMASAILSVNVLMRPVVIIVNHVTARFGSGSPVAYVVEMSCAETHQKRIRSLLVRCFERGSLGLRSLRVEPDRGDPRDIRLTAEIVAREGGHAAIELEVAHVSADADVRTASWSLKTDAEADPKLHLGS